MSNRLALTDDLLTGVDSLDDQHRHLFELANRVVCDHFDHFGQEWFRSALEALVDYIQYHFAAEEHLLSTIVAPDAESHRTWHDQFRLEMSELLDLTRPTINKQEIRLRLVQSIETGLVGHIRNADSELANCARRCVPLAELQLADSGTLRHAGALVAEVEEDYAATASILSVG